ncbi:type II toxin-antitoxin system Phd/YefM family antitoxin [Pendulispora brunnea]|uniref:Antitoxin n=1 Tax=Pendulispora brunnea TaxID=2905690 RepID=A0ABZ2KHV3_9BACT
MALLARQEWQLQQAKAEFSKVLERSQTEGPQIVTKHGVAAAVILSVRDYEALRQKKRSFKAFLRSAPSELGELDLRRDPGGDRDVDL